MNTLLAVFPLLGDEKSTFKGPGRKVDQGKLLP